ncbi:SMP-30/gluconolactonase/LRE family protein [Altererythrobacter sp. MTPC7]|uniref:SMP-30/gluconolactonase/LRE family protein n=1 Tax=Erythrobacteraceae TaxID=335929 RepID=UPI0036F250B4
MTTRTLISTVLVAGLALSVPAAAQDSVVESEVNYLTGDPADWPPELEATVAAPDNHRILLETDQVRVLEVTLAPGEEEPLHFHRWPSVLYIQQAGDWIDRDAEGNVIFDSREVPPMQFPLTMWKGPEAPHSPVNLSDDVEVRLIRVEIKEGIGRSAGVMQSSLSPAGRSPTHAEDAAGEAAALEAANAFLATLSTKDAEAYAAITIPQGRGTGTEIKADGSRIFFTYTFEELVRALPTAIPDGAVEALVNPMVRVDGDIAMVWSDYTFTIDGQLSHCGTDHFDLVRRDSVWRVFNLTWTTRHDDCERLIAAQDSPIEQFARDYARAWSSGKPEEVAAHYEADGRLAVNDADPVIGHDGIASVARRFMTDLPDMRVSFDGLDRDGQRIIFRWTLTGTNTGPGGTGARVEISGAEAWLIGANGLIADSLGRFNEDEYARQLATASAPPSQPFSFFPADRSLTHAEDGVVLSDGRLLVGDWDHGLVTLDGDGKKEPFGDFAAAGFRTRPDPLWNSPNGVSWEPDGRHVLVADITGGHIYRVDTKTEAVARIYDHPFGVNAVVRDPSGAIWFTQSTENTAGEGAEARMFAAADKPLGDGSVWRIAAEEVGKAEPRAVKVVDGLDFANGIVFDPARGRLYVNEIVANRILSFAVDQATGALSNRRVLATLPTPDNIELDDNGQLWVVSPFANAVYTLNPDSGAWRAVFAPAPEASERIITETRRRQSAGEPILPLLTPEMWGPMPGLLTGVILAPNGTVYISGLGDALVKLDGTDPPEIDLTPILANRTRVIIDGIRSGDVSEIMALFGPGSLYAADSETLLSDPASIREFWINVAASPAHDATLEVLRIERLGPDAFVEIQKYDVFDEAGERLFGGYASLLWRKVGGRWIIAADVSN